MKTARKAILLVLCVVLLVVASVMGTLAYLTDTEAVTNTFTVGKVYIELDEAIVDEMGNPTGGRTETPAAGSNEIEGNAYHLLPGHQYTKDPTVTVEAGSDESYVRMIVKVTFAEALTDAQLATDLDSIFSGYDANKWNRTAKTVENNVITYEYRYHTTVDGYNEEGTAEDQPLEALFDGFTVPENYNNAQIAFLGGMEISVTAHAIQAEGFANEEAAWAAFDVQHP